MLNETSWPEYSEDKCKDATIEIVVQVNGKLKTKLQVSAESSQEEVLSAAKDDDKVKAAIDGKNIVKEIYVKGKLVNIVAK